MFKNWKIITLLCFAFIIAGCDLQTVSTPDAAQTEQTNTGATATQPVAVGDVDKWQTLTRADEGFTMQFPQKWWWQRDSDLQTLLGARFVAGFSTGENQWEQKNYTIIFFIASKADATSWNGYQKIITTKDDNQYVLRGAPEYADIINAMAASFKFLTEEIDTSNWQTYRNEEMGFEVKYPPQYKIYGATESVFIGDNPIHMAVPNGVRIQKIDDDIAQTIQSIKNRDELTTVLSEGMVDINGVSTQKLVVTAAIGYNDFHYFFNNGKDIIEVIGDDALPMHHDIVSTFKVIN